MGTWGTGIYDNDYALDYVDNIMDTLYKDIREILEEEGTLDMNNVNSSNVIAGIDIVTILCNKIDYLISGLNLNLKLEAVKKWKKEYLKKYDLWASDDKYANNGYKKNRRIVIENTFNNLIILLHERGD